MVTAARRSRYLRLNAETLDQAKELGINVTEVVEDALEKAVSAMKRKIGLKRMQTGLTHSVSGTSRMDTRWLT
ncbi:type II toxin-antitoxin system CcdA family antitoxin [Roseibium album]|uniref:type II toxin-antitoxin system CcdA family antitoxin n=1 Tax=Roseibium album TaxID=311410 RepID=UPI00391CF0A4